jgi:ERF superfamily
MTSNLATALIAAKLNFKPITKTKTNPHYKSKYACLDSILEAISEALAASGLLLIQPTEIDNGIPVLKTILIHAPTGDRFESILPLPILTDPQKLGSALTYYRRYGICNLLAISPDEDDDGSKCSTLRQAQGIAPKTALQPKQSLDIFRITEITALGKSLGLTQSDITELVKNNFTCKVSQMNADEFSQLKSLMLTISTRQPQMNSN